MMEEDAIKLPILLKGLTEQVAGVTGSVQKLLKRVQHGDVSTDKGISFLDVKYHLLLSYLMNLTYVMLQKTDGRQLSGCPAIDRLVEIRTVLEKMRPVDQKLQYQVDKLVKMAATGIMAENDPLRHRPNPENLISKLEDDEDDSSDEKKASNPRKYIPPKLVAMPYDGDQTAKQKKERQLAKAKKRVLSSSLIQELRAEYLDGPEEIRDGPGAGRMKGDQVAQHKIEYEEDNFIRLRVTKMEMQTQKRLAAAGSNLNSLTKFDDIRVLDQTLDDMPTRKKTPSKKRKKDQKKSGKKRRYF